MKEFIGKTLDEALRKASEETEVEIDNLVYSIEEEKRTLF